MVEFLYDIKRKYNKYNINNVNNLIYIILLIVYIIQHLLMNECKDCF